MNTEKIYEDTAGNKLSIQEMVRLEPDLAASRVKEGEKAIKLPEEIKDLDMKNFMEKGQYSIPLRIRERIQRLVT